MKTKINPCLTCSLPECIDTDPNCALFKIKPKNKAQRDFYHRNKNCPKFRKKRHKDKQKWRKTPAGRESIRKTAAQWRKKNPEKAKEIYKRYYEKKKREKKIKANPFLALK